MKGGSSTTLAAFLVTVACTPHKLSVVCVVNGGTGGLMVKTRALDLVSQGSSPTSVRAFFSLSLCLTSMPWSSLSSTPSGVVSPHPLEEM